jgi:hypothetical protein
MTIAEKDVKLESNNLILIYYLILDVKFLPRCKKITRIINVYQDIVFVVVMLVQVATGNVVFHPRPPSNRFQLEVGTGNNQK